MMSLRALSVRNKAVREIVVTIEAGGLCFTASLATGEAMHLTTARG